MTFASDISSWQVPVNDSYPNPWLIFRACDGTYRDGNFAANVAWAKRACASGKLVGYTTYAVYEPGADTLGTVKAMVGTPDGHITVMIDVESWSGKIRGDHSADITALYRALGVWLGDERRVIVYGNQGDLASLYPHRPPAERLIVAAYGSTKPSLPGQIGWQYSDGQSTYPVPSGYPRNVAPFGPSDQNHFDLDPAALAAALGVGVDIVTPDEIAAVAAAVWQYGIKSSTGVVMPAKDRLLDIAARAADNHNDLHGLLTALPKPPTVAQIAAGVTTTPVDVNALAAQLVAKLGTDLATQVARAIPANVVLAAK